MESEVTTMSKYSLWQVTAEDGKLYYKVSPKPMTTGQALEHFGALAVMGQDDLPEVLNETVSGLLDRGMEVYRRPNAKYVWVTNGKAVVYMQYETCLGLSVSYEYVPSKENGAGCQIFSPEDHADAEKVAAAIEDLSEPTYEKLRRYNRNVCKYADKYTKREQEFFKDADEWKVGAELWGNLYQMTKEMVLS